MNKLVYTSPILISVLICTGQGCSTTRVPAGSVPVEDQSTVSETSRDGHPFEAGTSDHSSDRDKSGIPTPGSTAVVALLEQAQSEIDSGRGESAVVTLERALRVDAKNALLWHRLALIRNQQHQWQQALSLARKSNSLAAGDPDLQLANWRIIATASEKLQDDKGVERAREMIKKLEKYLGARGQG